jgi:iron(III) transport system ATP-binding protein
MVAISLRQITKMFGGSTKAVDALSLDIPNGEFVSLLGPSGCGKTTTLRMLAGLEDPTSGEIYLGDRPIFSSQKGILVPPEQRGMGLVFQSYALWPHMSVFDNVAFGLQMQHKSLSEQKRIVGEVLTLMQIGELAQRYPHQLSGGQQQRVALARNVAMQPQVLLLDEPLSNLDARLRLEMRSELKRLHAQLGNTMVFVTHDQLEAMTLSTAIAVMHHGQLQQYGSPMEIYHQPINRFVASFVGSPPINLVDLEPGDPLAQGLQDDLRRWGSSVAAVATVGFRPEVVGIHAIEESISSHCCQIVGQVETILPTGPDWIVQVKAGIHRLTCLCHQEPAVGMGDPCQISVRHDAFHLFNSQGLRVSSLPAQEPVRI